VHAEATLYGRMAAYAWGADYHDVLPRRMEELVHFIEAQVGRKIPHRLYTDTGPILERDLAQRAGLGWIGKNTCLINPRAGSYFLLSEILLGIELEPDTPFTTDQCGTCRRCVDACPTLCIQPDRTLDARRCVSYLTIELKDDIPPGLRGELGDWLFGCDICQMVCPWNRFAAERGDDAFSARPGSRMPVLAEALAMTDGDFGRRFRDSPVRRAKRRGYLRNVAVALGNQAGDDALPALWRAAEAEETMVRTHAAWAIEQIRQRSDA
jgi:epoxyqueuosine reductase